MMTLKEASAEIKDMGTDHTLNIYQRMLNAQTMIETVSKNLDVEAGKQKYKAVSERDILDAVKKVEKECGIYSYPFSRKVYENKATINKNGYETQWMRLEVIYRFINVDNPNEYIEVQTYGDGVDAMDKAPGKAMTYADKYALMKAYKISTGDDPDKDASIEQKNGVIQKTENNIGKLIMEWKDLRIQMDELKIDYRSESIKQWIETHTGYQDQEDNPKDVEKMKKINAAYKKLVEGKRKKNG